MTFFADHYYLLPSAEAPDTTQAQSARRRLARLKPPQDVKTVPLRATIAVAHKTVLPVVLTEGMGRVGSMRRFDEWTRGVRDFPSENSNQYPQPFADPQ